MLFAYILIGIIQGLTEFLPVSSSGHVVLATKWLGINVDTMFLTVIVHLGTLFAVIFVYRKRLLDMIKKPFTAYNFKIIISTLVTLICYLLFGDIAESAFDGRYLVYGFVISAIVLIISDLVNPRKSQVQWSNAITIGLAQGLALFPAVSRSGMTICAGVLTGVNREEAADFSFILSIPIILGSSLLELSSVSGISSNQIFPLVCAFVFAFLSGILAIKIMLKAIKKAKLYYFALYLIILTIILLAVS